MRRRTIPLFLTVCLLALAGATGCGSGDDEPPRTTTTASATQETRGLRFVTKIPASWKTILGQVTNTESHPDAAWADLDATGYKANAIFERQRRVSWRGRSVETIDAELRRATNVPRGTTIGEPRSFRLAGAPAVVREIVGEQGGQRLITRQVYATYAGELYVVKVTSEQDDDAAEVAYRQIVDAWRWIPAP